MLALCLVCFFGSAEIVEIPEIYDAVGLNEIAVSPKHGIYILNPREAAVYHYDGAGKRVGDFLKKGRGPGELTRPYSIDVDGDRVFVVDRRGGRIAVFDADGTFVAHKTLTYLGGYWYKVAGGWLMFEPPIAFAESKTQAVHWYAENLVDHQKIAEWPRGKAGVRVAPGTGVPIVPFNPASDLAWPTISADKKYAYVTLPGPDMQVLVIDAAAKAVTHRYTVPMQPHPFDTAWGEARMKEARSYTAGRANPPQFTADFPSFFPLAKTAFLTPDGRLNILRWHPDQTHDHVVTIDPKTGEKRPALADAAGLYQVVGKSGDRYVFWYYHEEDGTAGLGFAAPDQLARALADHYYAPDRF